MQCNSQSGTRVVGNKPIILRESYRQRLLFFCVSWFWSRSEIKTFFGVEYCGKKQIESGSALSVLLSTTIFVVTVVKMWCGLTSDHSQSHGLWFFMQDFDWLERGLVSRENPFNKYNEAVRSLSFTLFQNGRHFSIFLFPWKLALMASFSNVKFKRTFNLERGQKGKFAWKQKCTEMAAILE